MNTTHRTNGRERSYFVDDEFSFKATTATLTERDFHGVLDVAHLMAPHLILDVQTHHWKPHKNKHKLRRNGQEDGTKMEQTQESVTINQHFVSYIQQ